ncbi:MAG: UPF0182 family protein, partial [Actinomycetota bacterium]
MKALSLPPTRGRRLRVGAAAAAVALVLSASTVVRLFTDLLWYGEVGFASVFWTILGTQALMAGGLGIVFFLFCLANLVIAARIAPLNWIAVDPNDPLQRYRAAFRPHLRWLAIGGSAFLGLLFGLGATPLWDRLVLALEAVPFGTLDPVFNKDLAFFVFRLPLYRFLYGWGFSTLVVVTLVVAGAHYLGGGIRPQEATDRVTPQVKAHLSALIGLIALLRAWGYRLDQFTLLYSSRGEVTGASYTDVKAELPALKLLVVISVIGAALFLVNIRFKGWALPLAGAGLWLLISVLAAGVYPFLVQRFVVVPNELPKETPYLKLHIENTRRAYGLEGIEVREYPVTGPVARNAVEENAATFSNIRLWDAETLMTAYRQLQEIRPYYKFLDVDIDRYTIDGSPRQVLLSTREMDTGALESTNWQNTHLFYTHGYGAVVSAASEATVEGEPNFLVQDIPPKPESPELALTEPGIYFGEGLLGVYSLAPSAQKELDFAREAEQGNKLTSYAGRGGVPASGVLRRLAFAWRFRNINLAISGLITPESRILYYRQVRERLLKAAPFLHFDTDPYPVISDGRIVWVADAYTVSDMYPYSERLDFGDRTFRPTSYGPIAGIDGEFNYVRNSVKATVDAYDGTVSFYVWDPTDPIIRTWRRAFPALFKDAEDMPTSLRSHVRYPEDLFRIQTYIYQRYHMTEPTDFFTREDLWVIPADPNQSNEGVAEVQDDEIQPYYVLMRLPGAPSEEYALILPMNPRGKRNMISWLAAKSGPADYGRLIDFRFPKGSQIDGVGQAHAR